MSPDEMLEAYNHAAALADGGDCAAAREAFTRVVNLHIPHLSALAALRLGGLYEDCWQDAEGARRWYERAIAFGHFDVVAKAELALGTLQARYHHDPQAALRHYVRAKDTEHPDVKPMAIFLIGLLYEHTDRPEGARLAYEAAQATGHPAVVKQATEKLRSL